MTLTNLQALALAALTQAGAVAVAFGFFSTTQEQAIVSAAGAVIAVLVGAIQYLENQKAVAQITVAAGK